MKIVIIWVFVFIFLLVSPLVNAVEVIFQPNETNGTHTSINGCPSCAGLSYYQSTYMIIGIPGAGTEKRSMMNWSFIKDSFTGQTITVNTAKLMLYRDNGDGAGTAIPSYKEIGIFPLNKTWSTATTWNSFCDVDTSDCTQSYNASWNLSISGGFEGVDKAINQAINLTLNKTYIQNLIGGTLGVWNNGIMIRTGETETNDYFFKASGDVLANRPAVWVNYSAGQEQDTTPPAITYYNLTSSDNGCEYWNTNKNNACSTSSVTPTVQFNTSENAWCAISGNTSSTSGINYTEMGSSRNCTGASSGEGTTEHYCTLTSQDELVYDTSYLYISCKDASGNMNRSGTSTSGSLKLSITSLESNGRNSIGIGIQNALLSSYTNYTDLQIYARNLSNAQVKGTFDRAAKKGSKIWAFNRIGVSDSYVNMFNLTPVLYTLEFANTTSSQITLQVELAINATK